MGQPSPRLTMAPYLSDRPVSAVLGPEFKATLLRGARIGLGQGPVLGPYTRPGIGREIATMADPTVSAVPTPSTAVKPAGASSSPAQAPAAAPGPASVPGPGQGPSQGTPAAATTQPPDPRLEQLKRAEREFRSQQQAAKAELEAAKAELAKQKAEYDRWQTAKRRAKQDPNALLAEHGLTYEELTEAALNDGKPTAGMVAKTVDEIRAEIQAEFDKRDQAREQERAQAEADRRDAALQTWRGQTTARVKADASKYPLIAAIGVEAQVSADIEARYNETGEEMPVDQAAEALEGRLSELVEKVLALEKYKARLKESGASPAVVASVTAVPGTDGGTVVPDQKRHALREHRPSRMTLSNDDAGATQPGSSTRGMNPAQAWEALKRSKGLA